MMDAYEITEEAKDTARGLNDDINKTRDTANKLMEQYNCGYDQAFEVAKNQEGIVNFSDRVKSREKSDAKVKVYQMNKEAA